MPSPRGALQHTSVLFNLLFPWNLVDEDPSVRAGRGESLLSFASAPAQCIATHCFLPRTSFRHASRGRITAAELKKGSVVLGRLHEEISILRSIRHQPPVEVDMIHVVTEAHSYPFQVSGQHRVPSVRPNNEFSIVQACDLKEGWCLFDGEGVLSKVVSVKNVLQITELVEVTFAEDAIVPTWVLPKNAKAAGRPPLRDCAGVCCCGTRLGFDDLFSLGIYNTFWSVPCCQADGDVRASRSLARSSDGRLERVKE